MAKQNQQEITVINEASTASEDILSPIRFIQQLGYPVEKHIYLTDDGYINTVMRIPGEKGTKPCGKKNPTRPVALC